MKLRTQGCIGNPKIIGTYAPFSNFDFIEEIGPDFVSLRRIFSQARMAGFNTLVEEKIQSVGISAEDDQDLKEAKYDVPAESLIRLSFFKSQYFGIKHFLKLKCGPEEVSRLTDKNLIGYAILKKVPLPRSSKFRWIVFESIISASRHPNNYCHLKRPYQIKVGTKLFSISGNLYCQQNGITNVCAHVALRTVLSAILEDGDISYGTINTILKNAGLPFVPDTGAGLDNAQITAIFNDLKINYSAQLFPKNTTNRFSYQRHLYGSIESGFPALLGFWPPSTEGHILPILGHTFNEDTWVPHAAYSYFKLANDIRFIPSETWVSSYLCHDDNFGSNFCLPRQYISNDNQIMVFAIRPNYIKYSAIEAEVLAGYFLAILAKIMPDGANPWVKRLKEACLSNEGWQGWAVFRPILVTRKQYIDHLKSLKDWKSNKLDPKLIEILNAGSKTTYWMVEISLQSLFPANRRKLGEILLDPSAEIGTPLDVKIFEFARIVDQLYFLGDGPGTKVVKKNYATGMTSHTNLYKGGPGAFF